MSKKLTSTTVGKSTSIYERIRDILESARNNIARSVNTAQVVSNWLIGREIRRELRELTGATKARKKNSSKKGKS
ncbi:MAG: DUF1016 domain-containing protein [Planctomycetes bacterium]|nr:DUF1016 domain-containing protein [Planctomycetota bacterium]